MPPEVGTGPWAHRGNGGAPFYILLGAGSSSVSPSSNCHLCCCRISHCPVTVCGGVGWGRQGGRAGWRGGERLEPFRAYCLF